MYFLGLHIMLRPGDTTQVESLFSKCGPIIGRARAALTQEYIQQQLVSPLDGPDFMREHVYKHQ
jgi:hypothetical protein